MGVINRGLVLTNYKSVLRKLFVKALGSGAFEVEVKSLTRDDEPQEHEQQHRP